MRVNRCSFTHLQGVTLPAVSALMGKWAPPQERSRIISFTYLGTEAQGHVHDIIVLVY